MLKKQDLRAFKHIDSNKPVKSSVSSLKKSTSQKAKPSPHQSAKSKKGLTVIRAKKSKEDKEEVLEDQDLTESPTRAQSVKNSLLNTQSLAQMQVQNDYMEKYLNSLH